MSSVQSAYAQIGPREKYLAVTSATNAVLLVDNGTGVITSSMGEDAFDTATSGPTAVTPPQPALAAGQLYRDLGKTVVVHDDTTLLAIAKYQKVQIVNGPDSEGVGNFEYAGAYLLVWRAGAVAASGVAGTGVARVG